MSKSYFLPKFQIYRIRLYIITDSGVKYETLDGTKTYEIILGTKDIFICMYNLKMSKNKVIKQCLCNYKLIKSSN